MRYILTLLMAIVTLTGCHKGNKAATIEGNIAGLKPDTTSIYLYGCETGYERVDTINAIKGRFAMDVEVDTLTLLTLRLTDLISYPVFIDKGEKIEIEGTIKGAKVMLNVKGNSLSEELCNVVNTLNNRDSIALKPVKERVNEYIAENNTSLVSAYLLTHYLAYNDEDANAERIDSLIKTLAGSLSDNLMISALNEQLQMARRATNGKTAPVFNVKNDKGEAITRGNKFKDKYLLLTFWATWDKDSRSNNSALLKLSKKMKKSDKEFGMLGVALDMDKNKWRDAVKTDSLSWEQACETEMFNANIAEEYGVTTLPLNILIAPNGRILERDIPIDSVAGRVEKEIKLTKEREAKAKAKTK